MDLWRSFLYGIYSIFRFSFAVSYLSLKVVCCISLFSPPQHDISSKSLPRPEACSPITPPPTPPPLQNTFIIHRRSSSWFAKHNEGHYPPPPTPPPSKHIHHPPKIITLVCKKQQRLLPPHPPPHPTPPPFQTQSSSTTEHHLGLQITTKVITPPPPLPNAFIIHRRTSWFANNNKGHYTPTSPSKHIHHPPKNIIFVCKRQWRSLCPPDPTTLQTHSSSTEDHHLGLQKTMKVITPPPATPPHSPPFQTHSSSTEEHHLGLQITTQVITPPPPLPNALVVFGLWLVGRALDAKYEPTKDARPNAGESGRSWLKM